MLVPSQKQIQISSIAHIIWSWKRLTRNVHIEMQMLCLPVWVLFMNSRFLLKLWKTYFGLSKMSRLLFSLLSHFCFVKTIEMYSHFSFLWNPTLLILGRRSYVILWFIGLPFPRRLLLDLYQQCRPWGRISSSMEDRRLQTCFRQQKKGRDVSAVLGRLSFTQIHIKIH